MSGIGSTVKSVAKTAFATKTGLTAMAGIATAVGTYVGGEMSLAQAIQTAVTCLIGLFLRSGMVKG